MMENSKRAIVREELARLFSEYDGVICLAVHPLPQENSVAVGFATDEHLVGVDYPVSYARHIAHEILRACNYVEFGGKWEVK